MSAIELERLYVSDQTLQYEFTYPSSLRRFFSGEDFVVAYDVPVGDVPDGILVVPWLANVCPIAWATGTDVEVPTLDPRFADALPQVGEAFADLYPELANGSSIRISEATEAGDDPDVFDRSAMLFSGGVDSLATYYRHADEDPILINVHGHDVDLDDEEGWTARKTTIEDFARPRDLETRYVRANTSAFQEPFMLYAHFGSNLYSDWIDSVHLGLGLTGVCAPLSYATGVGRLYVADSIDRHHVDVAVDAVANHPSVMTEMAWSGTDVRNDGYPLTRQEKIDLIAERATDEAITIHVCLESAVDNCSRCEKCMRTVSPLLLAGLDPNEYGFDVDAEAFAHARRQFETGAWHLDDGLVPDWKDIQRNARERRDELAFPTSGADAFFEWLVNTDVGSFREDDVQLSRELLLGAARNTPHPVYAAAKNADPVVSLATRFLNR